MGAVTLSTWSKAEPFLGAPPEFTEFITAPASPLPVQGTMDFHLHFPEFCPADGGGNGQMGYVWRENMGHEVSFSSESSLFTGAMTFLTVWPLSFAVSERRSVPTAAESPWHT